MGDAAWIRQAKSTSPCYKIWYTTHDVDDDSSTRCFILKLHPCCGTVCISKALLHIHDILVIYHTLLSKAACIGGRKAALQFKLV